MQSNAESFRNLIKKHILNPKHAKFDQKSEIGHVRAVGGGRLWTGLGRSGHDQITTCWSNLARFGSRNSILTNFIDDSASFLPEKPKNHIILTNKNFNI